MAYKYIVKDLFDNLDLSKYKNIVIVRHEKPDLDALGSQYGLYFYLQNRYPHINVLAYGYIPEQLSWFRKFQNFSNDKLYTFTPSDTLQVVLDTSTANRVEDLFPEMDKIIIDHHPQVTDNGFTNVIHKMIKVGASSTSEILAGGVYLDGLSDKRIADCLYRGIYGDTGSFKFNIKSSTFDVLNALAQLVDVNKINQQLQQVSLEDWKLKRDIIKGIMFHDNVAYVYAPWGKYDGSAEKVALYVNEMANIEGIDGWIMFVEQPNKTIRMRIRSKNKPINKFAQRYNGGGHPLASGAYLSNVSVYPFSDVMSIVEEFSDFLKEGK